MALHSWPARVPTAAEPALSATFSVTIESYARKRRRTAAAAAAAAASAHSSWRPHQSHFSGLPRELVPLCHRHNVFVAAANAFPPKQEGPNWGHSPVPSASCRQKALPGPRLQPPQLANNSTHSPEHSKRHEQATTGGGRPHQPRNLPTEISSTSDSTLNRPTTPQQRNSAHLGGCAR